MSHNRFSLKNSLLLQKCSLTCRCVGNFVIDTRGWKILVNMHLTPQYLECEIFKLFLVFSVSSFCFVWQGLSGGKNLNLGACQTMPVKVFNRLRQLTEPRLLEKMTGGMDAPVSQWKSKPETYQPLLCRVHGCLYRSWVFLSFWFAIQCSIM